jgi:eukaryotic-like serine/threonine-protein kinase
VKNPIRTPWSELAPYVDRAFEMTPPECESWLAELDGTHPAIATDLRRLLEEREQVRASQFLEQTPVTPVIDANLEGRSIGAYTLDRKIGEGGMAEVWLATRSDGRFEGKCAIKFFDPSIHSAKLAERFRREGQILARLAHPNIARLFDAGAARDGRAFLVLEYIDGVRIDQHCASLAIDARVRLFVDVVAAVAHAHSHLVIHRDLKPSNVLVTREGQVKLLDFGIAKLIGAGLDDGTDANADRTKLDEMVLTPDYAAPEQLLGETPATTTDVYQLGLLLFVLLAGEHPMADAGSRSQRLRAVLDGRVPVASERAGKPDREALRGDLDAILAMALRREPAERYATAQAFREDLVRYLDHEPVLARRGAAAYRVRKFFERHRFGVTAAMVGTVSLIAALGFALAQGREAELQRDVARRELARATAANDFQTFQLSVAPKDGGPFTARDLLELSEELVEKQFADNDAMRSEMLATLGSRHLVSQRMDEASRLFRRAMEIAARIGDPALEARSACPLALTMVFNGDVPDAESMMRRALERLPPGPGYAQLRGECLTRFAEFGFITGDSETMIRHATEAVELLESAGSLSALRLTDARGVLAYGYYLAHQNRKADETFAATIAGFTAAGMERTLLTADTYNNWSLVHFRGDIRKAEPLLKRSLELRRLVEGGDVVPSVLFNYAATLLKLERFDQALPLYTETIVSAKSRDDMRTFWDASMELVELRLLRRETNLAQAQLATIDPWLTNKRFNGLRRAQYAYYQARLAEAQGDHEHAREKFAESNATFDKIEEKIALNVESLCGQSRSALILGERDGAHDAAVRALKLARSMSEPDSPSYLVGMALIVLGEAQRSKGNVVDSGESLRQARENLELTLGTEHELSRRARAAAVPPA